MSQSTIRNSSRRTRIFISYAREDHAVAVRLYRDLKEAGAEPWLDTENLLPGQRWKATISKAIQQSDLFIALISSNSVGKRGHVQKEIKEALDVLDTVPNEGIYVIPARLDDCALPHPSLSELNWVDLFPLYEAGLRKILLIVRPTKAVAAGTLQSAPLDQPDRLEQTGWGVIFPCECDPQIREALAPLLEHRRQEAGSKEASFYREFSGSAGYELGETAHQFLAKHGMGPGPADPRRVPYYLLLVGGPENIPFEFQYQLGLQHRVGRLDFESSSHYKNYAQNAVESELAPRYLNRLTFFGPEQDQATNFLVTKALRPLADSTALEHADWSVGTLFAEQATKENISKVFSGQDKTSVVFIGAHGAGYRGGHRLQSSHQGAIVCHEWPGPGHPAAVEECFSATDVPEEADLRGTALIHFGPWSAGSPRLDDFYFLRSERREVAPNPFVSALAKRLLGISRGALGLIGHVDQVWQHSFQWQAAGPQLQVFEAVLRALMKGSRVGEAMKYFSERYAEIAAIVSAGDQVESSEEENLRLAMIDARNYILLGDPAVRVAARKF